MSLNFCIFEEAWRIAWGGNSRKAIRFENYGGTVVVVVVVVVVAVVGCCRAKQIICVINDFGENRNRDLAHYLYIFFPQAGQPRDPPPPNYRYINSLAGTGPGGEKKPQAYSN